MDGHRFFALIECKDWKDKVGIEEIDKLDSKRRDLAADRTMICSNSGFTDTALRKARRVGIQAASVLAAGDGRVRVEVSTEVFARAFIVTSWTLELRASGGDIRRLPKWWKPEDVFFGEYPIVNWLADLTGPKLLENPLRRAGALWVGALLVPGTLLRVRDVSIEVECLVAKLVAESRWLSQLARCPNATIGYWDWLRSGIAVPAGASAYSPSLDMEGWEPVAEGFIPVELKPAPDEILTSVVLTKGLPRLDGFGVPRFDEYLIEVVHEWDDSEGGAGPKQRGLIS